MTRVNSAIDPKYLMDAHLLAEYREITRIQTQLKKRINSNIEPLRNKPDEFKLGTGHVTFFLDKQKFIHDRFETIKTELNLRDIDTNINYDYTAPLEYYNDYTPTAYEKEILTERILLRFPKNNTYYRKPISKADYIELINNSTIYKK